MISSFKDIAKFFVNFSLFILITIPIYLKAVPSKSQELLSKFTTTKLETICPLAPKQNAFQECFRSHLASALEDSRPLDFYSIIDKIEEVYQKDILHSDSIIRKEMVKLLYFENISLVLDHYQTFKVSRDSFTFLDIFTLPFASKLFTSKLIPIIEEFENFEPSHVPDHRYKLLKNKISHYHKVLLD